MENMRMFTADDLKNGMPDMGKDSYKYKPKKKTREEHKKAIGTREHPWSTIRTIIEYP